MRTWINNFINEDRGQDMVEYSLVLVLIGTVALIFISGMGISVNGVVSTVIQKLDLVSDTIS